MVVQDSELDTRLRALREAPTPSLPRPASDIRRTAHRRQQRRRVTGALGGVVAVAALTTLGIAAPWRPAPSPGPQIGASASASAPVTPTATPTVTGTGLTPTWNPQTNPNYRPGLLSAVDKGGAPARVTIEAARYVVDGGGGAEATFHLAPLADAAPTTYALAPNAKLYASATWTGLPRPTDGTDFAPATIDQLDAYLKSLPGQPQEVWFVLDGEGRVALLFQVYHP